MHTETLTKLMAAYYNSSDAYLAHLSCEESSADYNWAGYVKFAARFIKEDDKVLELGSGIGTSATLIAGMKNIDLTATDISEKFIKFAIARNKNPHIRFERQNCTRLTYADETFDVVTSMGLLEHIPTPFKALDEMIRVLKKNGTLIIVFPNWLSWFKLLKATFNFKSHDYFTRTRLEMLPWLLKSFYYFFQKCVNPKPIYRQPTLTAKDVHGYHSDEDMVYLAHPFDVKRYLQKKGCKVTRTVADTFRFSLIPALAPYGGVVATK